MPPIVIPKDDRIKYFDMQTEQNSQCLANFFRDLCLEEQKRIEALTGHREESVVKRLNEYRDRVQNNRQGDAEIRDKRLNEMRESER